MNPEANAAKQHYTKRSIFMVAGETSGEQYGALLAQELHLLDPNLKLSGVGGDTMAEAGVEIQHHVRDMAVVGLTEVLSKYSKLKAVFDDVVHKILTTRPNVVVLIDYPGFNIRLAKAIKGSGIPVVYYISPQIWAWHRKRVHDIAAYCDRILVIFDFEEELYADEGYTAKYVGHPLLDRMKLREPVNLRQELNVPEQTRIIGFLPGSRNQEIERLLPIYLNAAKLLHEGGLDIAYFLAAAPLINRAFLDKLVSSFDLPVKIFPGRAYDVMASSDLLFIASGTATLEAAVIGTPMIVTYKTGTITYMVGKSVLNVDWLALPNIIANAEIVPELLQHNCKPEFLAGLTLNILGDPQSYGEMKANLAAVRARLGGTGASSRAAKEIMGLIL